jgi:hypothetical protein
MTPITGIRGSSIVGAGRAPRSEAAPPREAQISDNRALIALQPIVPGERSPAGRPQASFLAHLIATDRQLPQTRARRRAEPADAITAYSAADAEAPPPAGGTLIRIM